jgi:predicted nuclease with TOPRIM domain
MPGLNIVHLAFSGARGTRVSLGFEPGLNLVFGASNTGKSFAYKSMDAALGASTRLPDIKERGSFDRLWLAINVLDEDMTLCRGLAGGPISLFSGRVSQPPPNTANTASRTLRAKHNSSDSDNVSRFLLDKIGLDAKQIATKAAGTKRSLSFRDIIRFCMVDETSIQSETSPALSGQRDSMQAERRVFHLLLTGNDDSAVREVVSQKDFKRSKSAKIEIVSELIAAIDTSLNNDYPDATELGVKNESLEAEYNFMQAKLETTQGSANALLSEKRAVLKELSQKRDRLDEVRLNLERFALLQDIYVSDIERLEALEEAGFLLTLGSDRDCPLCGASPSVQKHAHGLEEIALIRGAAEAEIRKINQQKTDLADTIQQLRAEGVTLLSTLPALDTKLKDIDVRLEALAPAINEENRRLTELLATRDRIKHGLALLEQRAALEARRDILKSTKSDKLDESLRLGLSAAPLHEFETAVSETLKAWRFPGNCHVSFDEETFDLKIDGKHRRDNGKGVRAITHAAFKVALLLHCQRKSLPHPGFLVLDTPLLTYRDPLSSRYGELSPDEKEIASLSLKDYFFQHLSSIGHGSQFIVFENVDPPANIDRMGLVHRFSGSSASGRFGLFPRV